MFAVYTRVLKARIRKWIPVPFLFHILSNTNSYVARALRNSLSQSDSKIAKFKDTFTQAETSLSTGVSIEAAIFSFKTYERIGRCLWMFGQCSFIFSDIIAAVDSNLAKLNSVSYENASGRPRCLPNTRLDIINSISHWITNASGEDDKNVLWLWGLAGSGKSTIATTVADIFTRMGRLAAFIYFERGSESRSDPLRVIGTLAYQIARSDGRLGKSTARDVIEGNQRIAQMDLASQFRELLMQPILAMEALLEEGLLLVVIDALDECGTAETRETLLAILGEELGKLPPFIRFIVTSRALDDIKIALTMNPSIKSMELAVSADDTNISIFIRSQLGDLAKKRPDLSAEIEPWPGEANILALVHRAAGLFIWAPTACRFIKAAYNATNAVAKLTVLEVHHAAQAALYSLYEVALLSCGDWNDADLKADCREVLGLILLARNPLSPNAIDQIMGRNSSRIISRFASVLSFGLPSDPVRTLHPSFRDFLSDTSRFPSEAVDSRRRLTSWRRRQTVHLLSSCSIHKRGMEACP
jgi:hypothetical protein